MPAPLVVHITEASEPDRMLIGGKGSSLITLMQHGAEVPPAFVLTTEAYRRWADSEDSNLLAELIAAGIEELEAKTGRGLGDTPDGLIVSVRSGAPVSMPGMMDTILNAGLGSLGPGTHDFLYQARARFLWQFAELVLGLEEPHLPELRSRFAQPGSAADLAALESRLAELAEDLGKPWPRSPHDELVAAATAVFESWQSSRARLYRRMRKIDDSLGTTVTIQQMVFGNRSHASGSGVAFTRNPTSGSPGIYGEFLFGGQGEEVVAGRETGGGLAGWRDVQPSQYAQLDELGQRLESASSRVHEIEFTVEDGRVYVLQCRPALLTARAAARVAVEMVEQGSLGRTEALEFAREHGFDPDADPEGLAVPDDAAPMLGGIPVGGGVGVGRAAFSRSEADEMLRNGDPVVFIAVETSPDLLPVMQKATALVTMHGGASSHAAVVARQLGTPCVVGVGATIMDGVLQAGAQRIAAGQLITVDGESGRLYPGDTAVRVDILTDNERTLRQWAEEQARG